MTRFSVAVTVRNQVAAAVTDDLALDVVHGTTTNGTAGLGIAHRRLSGRRLSGVHLDGFTHLVEDLAEAVVIGMA